MLPATSPKKSKQNKKNIREREEEARKIVDEFHEDEPYEFTKLDILAMIIAGFQVIMPLVILGAFVMFLGYFLFWIWIK